MDGLESCITDSVRAYMHINILVSSLVLVLIILGIWCIHGTQRDLAIHVYTIITASRFLMVCVQMS